MNALPAIRPEPPARSHWRRRAPTARHHPGLSKRFDKAVIYDKLISIFRAAS
jgi:hypothetical protein